MMFWYDPPGLLTYCLRPVSWLYRAIVALRVMCYRFGLKSVTQFPVPVIIVGNITVGGSGKSPLVGALAERLQQQGYRPGIVSRGYGGKVGRSPHVVTAQSDPKVVGDEPLMLAHQTHCPIVVSPNRVAAVKLLLDQFNCTVVISDDGLQHHALGRDIEIAVIDGVRRFGNALCLPAGPLREPLSRLSSVDYRVANGVALAGEVAMELVPQKAYAIQTPTRRESLRAFAGKTVHAVAGIGYPQRFFQQLRELGMTVIEHPFPDHHRFQPADIEFDDAHWVFMTEKDAVKCQAFADPRHWCVPVRAKLPDSFFESLQGKL